MNETKLILLAGPTAVGKTEASLRLAQYFDGEIISGDSMQVFRGFDIGTAKIKPTEMKGIPHHLIDVKDANDAFSAAEFKRLVDEKIADITARGRLPLLVGGTGFYLDSVIYDYDFAHAAEDKTYRAFLQKEAEQKGNDYLYQKLRDIDPQSCKKIHLHDTKRIIRALEVYHVTGQPLSSMAVGIDRTKPRYHMAYMALDMARKRLYERINERVDAMIAQGWLEEVRQLLAKGADKNSLAMQGLGYRHLNWYLDGMYSWEKTVELIKRDTRHFAKRQLTWFRHDANIHWLSKEGLTEDEVVRRLIAEISRILS